MNRFKAFLALALSTFPLQAALPQAFSAYSNAEQHIANQGYTQVTFDGVEFVRDGGRYLADHSMWCPEVKKVSTGHIEGQIWVVGGYDMYGMTPPNPTMVVKIHDQDMVPIFTGIGHADANMPGTGLVQWSKTIEVKPGQCFWVAMYASAATYPLAFPAKVLGTVDLTGGTDSASPLHQYWSGHIVK